MFNFKKHEDWLLIASWPFTWYLFITLNGSIKTKNAQGYISYIILGWQNHPKWINIVVYPFMLQIDKKSKGYVDEKYKPLSEIVSIINKNKKS